MRIQNVMMENYRKIFDLNLDGKIIKISLLKDLKHKDYHHCKQRTLCLCECHFIPQINQ